MCPGCRGSCLSLAGIVGSFSFKQAVWPVALELAPPVSQDTAFPCPGGPQVVWGKGTAAGAAGPRQPLQGGPASVDKALSPSPQGGEPEWMPSKCCLPRGAASDITPRPRTGAAGQAGASRLCSAGHCKFCSLSPCFNAGYAKLYMLSQVFQSCPIL